MKRRTWLTIILVGALIFGQISPGIAASVLNPTDKVVHAVQYLKKVQNSDGGFPMQEGKQSSGAVTAWVIMALNSAGENLNDSTWVKGGDSPLEYLKGTRDELSNTCDYARFLLALSTGVSSQDSMLVQLSQSIKGFQQSNGQIMQPELGEQDYINAHIWSILALGSVGQLPDDQFKAKEWLLSKQGNDGGFSWCVGVDSDVDDTAAAIQALVQLGEKPGESTAIKHALTYIKKYQNDDGGFSSGAWTGIMSNSNTDAWVIQALIAAGVNPGSEDWQVGGHDSVSSLLDLQASDGSFNWMKGSHSTPVLSTAYAIIALMGKPFSLNINSSQDSSTIFKDLTSEYWAYQAIMELASNGIIGGYPDGSFMPEKSVTRAEFAVMLVKTLHLQPKPQSQVSFSDVESTHWAFDSINTVVENGLMHGNPDGTYNPDGLINGAEIAVVMVQASNVAVSEEPAEPWYAPYVAETQKIGLTYPGFQSQAFATRAQCASVLAKVIK